MRILGHPGTIAGFAGDGRYLAYAYRLISMKNTPATAVCRVAAEIAVACRSLTASHHDPSTRASLHGGIDKVPSVGKIRCRQGASLETIDAPLAPPTDTEHDQCQR